MSSLLDVARGGPVVRMGELLLRYRRIKEQAKAMSLPENEHRAVERITVESAQHGSLINNRANADIPPSFRLGVFRKYNWRCGCGSRRMLQLVRKGETDNTFHDQKVICATCAGS